MLSMRSGRPSSAVSELLRMLWAGSGVAELGQTCSMVVWECSRCSMKPSSGLYGGSP
jgi:hypothetical protein